MAYDTAVTREDEQNKKRGMIISVAIHVVLVMMALLPLLTFPDPPPGQAGILVNLGLPDEGQGSENAGPAEPATAEEVPVQPQEEATPPPSEPKPSKPEPEPKKEVITTEDPSQVAIRKEQERKERERQEQLEQQRREQERLAQERREQEARERAEREAKEREAQELKNSIGGLFGEGEGKGETGKPGNQGDPGGDPNADRVTGISTGSGVVEGFGGRGVVRSHKPQDNSQDQGTVVVRACIDKSGNVISAEFTQAGSTATSSRLKQLAVDSAKRWKFAAGQVDKQCGKIIFNFRLN